MKWEVITNERSSLQEYRLIDNEDCKLVIKYNPLHHSARITSGNHHRLFFFESTGSLSGKTIFRNEYGMEIGSLVHDKFHSQEGTLVIDNKKYQYLLQNKTTSELVIYNNDPQRPIANCSLPVVKKTAFQNFLPAEQEIVELNCFLLGLCWYLVLPIVKENSLVYASASF